jgi:hypothetical protein
MNGNIRDTFKTTGPARTAPFPDFAVIGSMRAGTTMIHEVLSSIKGLCLSRMKETDYFIASKNLSRGEKWYSRQFDDPHALCGEVSPNYTKRHAFPGVAERLHRANPKARLIYIVRDPVDRAISQYHHSFLMGHSLPEPEKLLSSHEGRHILATSRYAWQLDPWIATFGREALLIADFEELIGDPEPAAGRMARFIGLETVEWRNRRVDTNSSAQLGGIPDWWLRLRQTRFGSTLRATRTRSQRWSPGCQPRRFSQSNICPSLVWCAMRPW